MFNAIDTLLFDLDDTIYPREKGVMKAIIDRITLFIIKTYKVDQEEADKIRIKFRDLYGSTITGMMVENKISSTVYTNFIYDINYDHHLGPDTKLQYVLGELPHRKIIYTNGAKQHAMSVLKSLGVLIYFDQIVSIEDTLFYGKPDPQSYREMLRLTNINASRTVFLDDQERNLIGATKFGIKTVHVNGDSQHADKCLDRITNLDVDYLCNTFYKNA